MKATRKLIPALALLLVSAVLLSTASYAWFTTNTTVTATTSVSVTAPENLQISTDGSANSWTTAVTMEKPVDGHNVLRPVSSIDGKNFYTLGATATLDNIIDDVNYILDEETGDVKSADGNTKYGTAAKLDALDDYVYTDTVYLLSGNAVGAADSTHNLGATVTITTPDAAPYNKMKSSLRIMIEVVGDTTTTYIFGDDGFLSEKAIYEDTDGKYQTGAVSGTEEYTTGGDPKVLTGATLAAGNAKTVNVYVWYEGNDTDCVSQNVIATNSISIEIKFELVPKA